MSSYKLTYFPIMALAEPIRYMLSYMGKEFEDERIDPEKWPELKKGTPFGKLPTLEIDGKVLTQSAAICRYLGKQVGLSGKDDWESMQIDIMVDTFTDMRLEVSKFVHEQDEKAKQQKKDTLINETIPYYFTKFDEIIAKNGGYLANNSLSWGDLYVISFSDTLNCLMEQDCVEKYKNLDGLRQTVKNLPKIKEWIEKRPKTKF